MTDFPKLKRIEIVPRKVNFPALDELKKKLDEQDELTKGIQNGKEK